MMRSPLYWLLLPLLAGCDPAEAAPKPAPEPVEERSVAASPAASSANTPARAADADVSSGAPKRGELRGGEPVERIPQPPNAHASDLRLGDLPPDLQRAVEASPVPVLVPPAAWRDGLVVIPLGDNGYSLRARAAASKLIVQASKRARLYPDMPGAQGTHALRGAHGALTVNEGIRSASWIEAGVAYTADLECGDAEAPECRSDEGFTALLDRLVFVAEGDAAEEPRR